MSSDRSATDDTEVLDALQRLGLATTEARVLIGLHQLGTATARDVSRVTDVSRPQVYSAVEGLEQRGLINSQQANPKQFHPVTPDETEALLTRMFEQDIELVADYLADVAEQRDDPTEEREDIWTVRGREAISERVIQLIEAATSRVVFGVQSEELLTSEITETLRERAASDVDILLISSAPAVRDQFSEDEDITMIEPGEHMSDRDHTGRMLLIDHETVLHSVLGAEELPGLKRETAYWSSGSGFASTLIAMMERFLDEQSPGADRTDT